MAEKKVDRYRCAKCPTCGRMMKKYMAYLLWSRKGRSPIYGAPNKQLTVWICLKCGGIHNV